MTFRRERFPAHPTRRGHRFPTEAKGEGKALYRPPLAFRFPLADGDRYARAWERRRASLAPSSSAGALTASSSSDDGSGTTVTETFT